MKARAAGHIRAVVAAFPAAVVEVVALRGGALFAVALALALVTWVAAWVLADMMAATVSRSRAWRKVRRRW